MKKHVFNVLDNMSDPTVWYLFKLMFLISLLLSVYVNIFSIQYGFIQPQTELS